MPSTSLDPSARVHRARTRLLLDSPWFGTLSMRLHIEETTARPTMSTDGTKLLFNAAWVEKHTDAELLGTLAHEVLHCALRHPYRVGGRDMRKWNEACDLAINPMLKEQGFTLPQGATFDPQYSGMAAEQIYAKRAQDEDEDQQQQPQDSPTGDFTAPAEPEPGDGDQPGDGQQPTPMTATDWQVATEQATAVAKKAGKMDGGNERAIRDSRPSETNWREILRRFVEQTVPQDYSWSRPNRRHVANGVYLPGIIKENTPRLAVGVDTSASITQDLLDLFASELTAIMHETRPEALDVIYCDYSVRHAESFSPEDDEVKLKVHGGGGTRFQPVFDHVNDKPETTPAALIYFTDLEGPEPEQPDYPVLWVTTEATALCGPFGETVRLSQWT
jgi:predicted metal-dependent peptidase